MKCIKYVLLPLNLLLALGLLAGNLVAAPFVADSFPKFDEYGDITIGSEKARLDNFAIELQFKPNTVGYIIVYGGRRSRVGIARTRAVRARNFLVEYRGVPSERLVWIDGGYREELTTELYILPRGASAPTASPTVAPSEVKFIREAKPKKGSRQARRRRA